MQTELLDAETSTELTVASKYGITKATIQDAIDAANDLAATNPTDKAGIEKVRRYRLDVLRPMRLTVDRKHDEIKKEALRYCKVTDQVAKELKAMIEPAEERLQEIEDAPKREAERLAKIAEEARVVELDRRTKLAFGVRWQVQSSTLDSMTQEKFEESYAAEKARFEREEKARADAQAELQAEKERQELVAQQQRDAQAEIDRQAAALAEQQRKIDDANRQAREKIVNARMQQLEAVGSEVEPSDIVDLSTGEFENLLVVETRKFENAKADIAEAERIRKEQAAADLKARIEREAKELADKLEADRLAAEQKKADKLAEQQRKAERRAARAPDREKVRAFALLVSQLEWPKLSKDAVGQQHELETLIGYIHGKLEAIAASLE